MEINEKVIALYKYIHELCALKYRTVADVNKQPWVRYLKDIPDAPEYISVFYRDRVEEETDDSTVLLAVKKPNFQHCPDPPDNLIDWLESGWDDFEREVQIKDITPLFEDAEQRVNAFEKWIVKRNTWAEKQRVINKTRRFFTQLFETYTDLERDSETLELMVGNGIINEAGNNAINHPILLKRVKLQFDATANIISIHDTDTEPELYTLLLQDMRDINHSVVKQLSDDLHKNFYHPLDRNDAPDFLKILTHRLCPESQFITDKNDMISSSDRIITTLDPVFFMRKRIDGTLKAIEEIIQNIEAVGDVPKHLLELVAGGIVEIPEDDHELTIEEQLAALNGESLPILLSMEANREQLEIAERIEQYNAVLVQGPPGTGKTHTIANLLGHFLAQGKSVLVTSQTKKALSVLKEKVPNEIKNLCVSVLDDTNQDMVRSVDGISEYMSKYTSNELKKRVEVGRRQRTNIIEQLAETRKKIYAIKYKEFEPIVYNGDSYSPAKASAFVHSNAEGLSYIPGKVKLYHPLPVNAQQLVQLYRSNAGLSEAEERELILDIPSPESIFPPAVFEDDLLQTDKAKSVIAGMDSGLFIQNPTPKTLAQLSQYIDSFNDIDGWMMHAAVDGRKGGGYRRKWQVLIDTITDTAAYADSIVANMLGKNIEVRPEAMAAQIPLHLPKLMEIFRRKGKIPKVDLMLNKPFQTLLSGISINGIPIATENDCILVQQYLSLNEKRNKTALLWNELIAKHGTPEFFSLDDEPEIIGLRIIPDIERYLSWYENENAKLLQLVEQAGLNAKAVFCESAMDSELVYTEKLLSAIHRQLPQYIELGKQLIILGGIEDRRTQTIRTLSEAKRKQSATCNLLIDAIVANNPQDYECCYRQLSELYAKYELKSLREKTLSLIESVAPTWADAIKNRTGIHGDISCPQTIEDAWKWKQFAGIIDDITAEPFEDLQCRAVALSKELRKATAKVAADSAWYHLMLRTEQDLSMRQALQGWKLTVKKIGKGTGKNAPALKKQARGLMSKCQTAVPAWIMTISKAMESLVPGKNYFDVIIIDEASQSDLSALAIMYMAQKIIIVGDDKQVSPMAVGVDIDKMNALRDMYIKDMISAWHLYDAKTSLYDIAGTTFQPLMLREHFRCLPDIIGYSNKLSYDYKIKPLRDAGSSRVSPPVVKYRVDDGRREGRQKINIKEAKTVVALMIACVEQKEYEGMTFGAISLLGDEQAQKIQELILQKIDMAVIEQRRILCGNASHFQGDERDVIFLSLVDSNEGDGPLSMAGEGSDQSRKQRYNVAASRAKDQLWVVHSLDYSRDLKNGDLRRDLLEYAENPQAFNQLAERVSAEAESPFEEAVGKALVAAGYHVVQQWEVGAYRLDMVILYNGSSVAVECDGESFHSGDEAIRADMERQAVLERSGWRFIRIRGSEYYRNPDKTMERVKSELTAYGIFPETVSQDMEVLPASALLECVKIRASRILDEWNEEKNIIVEPVQKEEKTFKPIKITASSAPRETAKRIEKSYFKQKRDIAPKGADLAGSLVAAGIAYIDNRAQSGIIWIPFSNTNINQVEQIINEYGARYSFERRGSKATGNQPAWRIMTD